LLLLCLAFLPAGCTDWPAFHLVVILGIHFIGTRPLRAWPWIIAFGAFSVILFVLLYAQVVAVTHDWRWMSRLVARRALSSTSDANHTFTFWEWTREALRGHAQRRHTQVGFWLLACWTILALTQLRAARSTQLILIMLGWAVLHIAVGRQGVFVHEWWWWPLTPVIAMASGVALDWALTLGDNVRPIVTTGIAIVMLSLWGGINLAKEIDELRHPYPMWSKHPELDYTVVEMGDAIRAAAPFNHPVMVAEKDATLGRWFYADRPVMESIWSVEDFESRLNGDIAQLQFDLAERCVNRPAAIVIPKAYDGAGPLIAYLDSRYLKTETKKFITFRLR
jgi:hypothetical protein